MKAYPASNLPCVTVCRITSSVRRLPDETIFFEFPVQCSRADSELLGGARLVSTVHLQHREDVLLFDLTERLHHLPINDRFWESLAELLGQIFEVQTISACERYSALHGVLQLANVARPFVAQHLVSSAWGETCNLAFHPNRCLREQYSGERQDVVPPVTERRSFSREFKVEAVKLVTEQGYSLSGAARSLGVDVSVIRSWKKKLELEGADGFVGQGRLKPEDEELRRLREENRRLRMERDILKKAAAFFAKESP